MNKKIFILGIDGASYDLIKRYMASDKLPNFQKLEKVDSFAKLDSTVPPHTAPGWATAFTGVDPGQHGVYQFWDTQAVNYEGNLMGSNDFAVEPIWHLLNRHGIKTGVVNVPMTHPPHKVDGYMISWPLSNTLRYCEPPEMLIGIAKNKGHYVSDYVTMYDGKMDYIDRALEFTRKRVKTCEYLINNTEWDILINIFTEVDRVAHFYWQYMDKESLEYDGDVEEKYVKAIENIYVEVDRALGEIIKLLPKETPLIILSDHGFGKGEFNYYIQTFFMDKSLLQIKEVQTSAEEVKGAENSNTNWFEVWHDGKKYEVDWTKTIAYMAAPGSYGVNINLKGRQAQGIVEEEDYEKYRDLLIKEISSITHPTTGLKLFPKVLRREEVYFGEQVKNAPDLIVIPENYGIMLHHVSKPGVLIGSPEQKGMHRNEGIIGIYGDNYELTSKFKNARLEDISPTILAYFGVTKPQYMAGETLCKFHNGQTEKAMLKETYVKDEKKVSYSEKEVAEAKEGLHALGYL